MTAVGKTSSTNGRDIDCGEGCVSVVLKVGGNAVSVAHKGQSSLCPSAPSDSASPNSTNCMPLALVHTNSMPFGFATGEAMATPSDNTNHTSTRRVIWQLRRMVCMLKIVSSRPSAKNELHQSFRVAGCND